MVVGRNTNTRIFKPLYDLSDSEVQLIVRQYFQNKVLPNGRFVGVVTSGDEELTNAARTLECQEFKGEFNNDAKEMSKMYGFVEFDSFFLLVLDRNINSPVGVMRIVGGVSAFLLTLTEAPEYIGISEDKIRKYHKILNYEKAWDVATFAIAKQYRGKFFGQVAINGMLERMFVRLGTKENIIHVFAMLDSKALRGLDSIGVPFKEMGGYKGGFPYKGSSLTYAMIGYFPDFQKSSSQKYKRLKQELFLWNVIRFRSFGKAIKQRAFSKIAGMAALGIGGIDKHIVLP